jgi:hypothetical protein
MIKEDGAAFRKWLPHTCGIAFEKPIPILLGWFLSISIGLQKPTLDKSRSSE